MLLLLLIGLSDPDFAADMEALSFMQGHWRAEKAQTVLEEWWTDGRGGLMLGANRTVTAGRLRFYEQLRIEINAEGIFYVAMPSNQEPAKFRLVETGSDYAVFENKAHDFPQRIIYRLEGADRLTARIEGEVDGEPKSSQWSWQRVEP